ncbi:MAG TPA: hypothetical protein VF460_10450 [Burkholderiales bacterium]
MPRKQPQLAKLTRPRLHRAIERRRLFAVLDEAHDHKAAICVVGPPGAGKTTLVASWLDARAIKGIWYQVDPGDADLATFFYYLGEATRPFLRRGQRPCRYWPPNICRMSKASRPAGRDDVDEYPAHNDNLITSGHRDST